MTAMAHSARHQDDRNAGDIPAAAGIDTPLDRLLGNAASALVGAGIDTAVARAEAEDLLSWALRHNGDEEATVSRVRLWGLLGTSLAREEDPHIAHAGLKDFFAAIVRRTRREPLQWIEGTAPFRGLDLLVGPGVFVPRPETEQVAGAGIDLLRPLVEASQAGTGADAATAQTAHVQTADARMAHAQKVQSGYKPVIMADLFAGSGAIGLACAAQLPGLSVIAVEKSPAAYSFLRRNAEAFATRYPWLHRTYVPILADVFEAGEEIHAAARGLGAKDGLLDAVITNPPYLPLDRPVTQPEAAADPDEALYGGSGDGLAIPERTIALLPTLLRTGGIIVMEHDPTQQRALQVQLEETGFSDVRGCRDLAGRPRWVQARFPGIAAGQRRPGGHKE